MSKKKGVKPKGWTQAMYEKFERCIKEVKKKNKGSKKKYNPYAICHAQLGYDAPEPYDIHIQTSDVIIRLVPEIDNLLEVALYIDDDTFKALKEKLDQIGIRYELLDPKYIARRGRKEKATNVFIIGGN